MVIVIHCMVADLSGSNPFLARMLVSLNETENKKQSKTSVEFCRTHQSFANSPCFLISVCAFSLSAGRPTEGPSASAEALLMPVLEGQCYVIIHAFFSIRDTSNLDVKKSLGYLQELRYLFNR